jgi:hypothetical protein
MSGLRGKCDEIHVVFATFARAKIRTIFVRIASVALESPIFGAGNRKYGIVSSVSRICRRAFSLAQNLLNG